MDLQFEAIFQKRPHHRAHHLLYLRGAFGLRRYIVTVGLYPARATRDLDHFLIETDAVCKKDVSGLNEVLERSTLHGNSAGREGDTPASKVAAVAVEFDRG